MISSGDDASDAELADCPAWPAAENFKSERDLLGLYMTGHPLRAWKRVISSLATFKLADLAEFPMGKKLHARVCGMLSACTVRIPKVRLGPDGQPDPKQNRDPWAILRIDDESQEVDVFCFSKAFAKHLWLKDAIDTPVVLSGEVSHRRQKTDDFDEMGRPVWVETEDVQFLVQEAHPLEEGVATFGKRVVVTLPYDDPKLVEHVGALRALVDSRPGLLKVSLSLAYANGAVVEIDAGKLLAEPSAEFFTELGKLVPRLKYRLETIPETYVTNPPKPKFVPGGR